MTSTFLQQHWALVSAGLVATAVLIFVLWRAWLDSARGRLAMVEGNAAVRQAIQMLLSTAPGERVMRPGYGCDLQRLVFAPNDDTTAGLASFASTAAAPNETARAAAAAASRAARSRSSG